MSRGIYSALQHTATQSQRSFLNREPLWVRARDKTGELRHLQHPAAHCSTLQHTATHCNTLHHIVAPEKDGRTISLGLFVFRANLSSRKRGGAHSASTCIQQTTSDFKGCVVREQRCHHPFWRSARPSLPVCVCGCVWVRVYVNI